MSDVVATYGLDYGDFRKGLAEVERYSARHFIQQEKASQRAAQMIGRGVKGLIGASALRATVQHISRGIKEYSEINEEAGNSLKKLKGIQDDYFRSVGRVYTPVLDDLNRALEGAKGFVGTQITSYQNAFATLMQGGGRFGEGPEDLDRYRIEDEESQRVGRFLRLDALRRMQDEADILDASGKSQEAAKMRERMRNRRETQEISNIADPDHRSARQEREERLHKANMARINREAQASADADGAQAARDLRKLQTDRELHSLDARSLAIDQLRAQGRDHEADQEATKLEYARNAIKIRNDEDLSESERASRLFANEARQQHALDIINEARAAEQKQLRENIDLEVQMIELQAMRASGMERQAEAIEMEIKRRKALASVDQLGLPEHEATALRLRINRAFDTIQNSADHATPANGVRSQVSGGPMLEGGHGGRMGLGLQVFGRADTQGSPFNRMVSLAQDQLNVQRQIARNTARNVSTFN